MNIVAVACLSASALLQALAAFFSLRHTTFSPNRLAWYLIAFAFGLRSIRLWFQVYLSFTRKIELYFWDELLGLAVSLAFAMGVFYIGPLLAAMRDSELEKRAALKLAQQSAAEARHGKLVLEAVMENIPVGIAVAEAENRTIQSINRVGRQMAGILSPVGLSLETYKDSRFFRAGEEAPAKEGLPIYRALQGDSVKDEEWQLATPGGSLKTVLVNACPVLDPQGNIIGAVVAWYDFTDRKHMEEVLLKARVAAEEANRLKDEFLSNISHEIRTPLTVIVGASEWLEQNISLDETSRHLTEMIHTSSSVLQGLIEDLLDFSALEAGSFKSNIEPFEVADLLRKTCDQFEPEAHRKGIGLHLLLPPDLPSPCLGDPARLSQVLGSLIDNALKFTENGRIEISVSTESISGKDCRFRFSVRDTGIGIPASKQNLIFRPFVQVDGSATRQYGGTGLGLALCKRIIEGLGGSIGVSSEENKETTFYFLLDLVLPATPGGGGDVASGGEDLSPGL